MSASPFAFYRGTARIMAADLASTPTSGLVVQLGGDAHLSNYGAYASPSRKLVFDANDFDETLPGPWEWDVKRLATSFAIAGQHLGFAPEVWRAGTVDVVRAYQKWMRHFAELGAVELWSRHLTVEELRSGGAWGTHDLDARIDRFIEKAQARTSRQALGKLAEEVDGRFRIRSEPPLLFPLRDLPGDYDAETMEAAAHAAFERYKDTVSDDRHVLLDRFRLVDVGVKVVGVGSVGTRCFVLLLEGRDRDDPLFLQVKEANASVLEEHLGPSLYAHHGRRVVEGQRLTQAESDIFLGWCEGDLEHVEYYVRQLRDWKGSVDVESGTPEGMYLYAELCGRTMARGHARSGDAIGIAAYLGKSDRFAQAVADFSAVYADQTQQDYEAFTQAIRDGRLPSDGRSDDVE